MDSDPLAGVTECSAAAQPRQDCFLTAELLWLSRRLISGIESGYFCQYCCILIMEEMDLAVLYYFVDVANDNVLT